MIDGKLYCYVGSLRGLSDRLEHTSRIHVGSGSIQYGTRLHYKVFDELIASDSQRAGYSARSTSLVSDISLLWQDTASPGLQLHGMVEERLDNLSFKYRISSRYGALTISPGKFSKSLRRALHYKVGEKSPKSDVADWLPLSGGVYILVEGEGGADISDRCHLLRPMRSNLLGRCVAISGSRQLTALVKNDEELADFARFWDFQRKKRPDERVYYSLVS